MGRVLVEVPDVIELVISVAHVAAHEGEARSLDADVAIAEVDIAVGAVVAAVVSGTLNAEVVAEVVLTSNAHVARVRDVVDGVSLHDWNSLPSS